MFVNKLHTQEKLFTLYSLSESKDHPVLLIWFFGREFSFGSKWIPNEHHIQNSYEPALLIKYKKLTWKLQLEPSTFYFHDAHM